MMFIQNYLAGLLALALASTAMPADASTNLEVREACFGGSYSTCVETYFDDFCLVQCASANLIGGEDCRQECTTSGGTYCENECT
ncbi:uncharacterized protein N7483_005534 [Penicillium malachiteum]|uniref:uncharacterized protein n=1 Tax=Penicillium malachiteum TaxID=1324776 RepID=UPI0025473369|nr:uncharacterized protein N7483_005534 [Penicillium malachiteum]KAJ5731026.1 hypothetical protein N7483_005534 [Penicillium malachiteum]